MNTNIIGGFLRHLLTIIASAVLASNTTDLNTAFSTLMEKIASGDVGSITSAIMIIVAILWSMWVKISESTKRNVVNTLTFKRLPKTKLPD